LDKVLSFLGVIFALILMLFLTSIVVFGGIKILCIIHNAEVSIKGEIDSSVLAIIVAAIVSLFTILISKWLESRAENTRKKKEKKITIYEDFMSFWFGILVLGKSSNEKNNKNIIDEKYLKWVSMAILWGSDDFIKAFSQFRKSFNHKSEKPDSENNKINPDVFSLFGKTIIEMRKDLGYKALNEDEIFNMFILDWEDYKKNIQEKKNTQ